MQTQLFWSLSWKAGLQVRSIASVGVPFRAFHLWIIPAAQNLPPQLPDFCKWLKHYLNSNQSDHSCANQSTYHSPIEKKSGLYRHRVPIFLHWSSERCGLPPPPKSLIRPWIYSHEEVQMTLVSWIFESNCSSTIGNGWGCSWHFLPSPWAANVPTLGIIKQHASYAFSVEIPSSCINPAKFWKPSCALPTCQTVFKDIWKSKEVFLVLPIEWRQGQGVEAVNKRGCKLVVEVDCHYPKLIS